MKILPLGKRKGPEMLDLSGKRFGILTALEAVGRTPGRHVVWRCACDCGAELQVNRMRLVTGGTKSCGCDRAVVVVHPKQRRHPLPKPSEPEPVALARPVSLAPFPRAEISLKTGSIYGELTAIERLPGKASLWRLSCSCGAEAVWRAQYVAIGRRSSCGHCVANRAKRGVAWCPGCNAEKPLDEFWSRNDRGGRRQSRCKRCLGSAWSESYRENIEASRARSREYAKRDPHARERATSNRERYPLKRQAQLAVRFALARGDMVRPARCSKCDDDHRVEGHHDDYTKPLDVMWLCTSCHRARHKELRALGRDPHLTAIGVAS